MPGTRLFVVAALVAVVAGPARAEDPRQAGNRIASSLLRQLEGRPPRPPVTAVSVAPPEEGSPIEAREATEALAAALTAAVGGVQVRDWSSLNRALAERAWSGALQGDLGLPALDAVQAIVVTEASSGGDGTIRFHARLVAVPSGAALAADAATLPMGPSEAALAPATGLPAPVQSRSIEVTMRRISDALAAGFYELPGTVRTAGWRFWTSPRWGTGRGSESWARSSRPSSPPTCAATTISSWSSAAAWAP